MKEVRLHWCPKEMVADFWTKPLQGSQIRRLRDYIMGRVRCVKPKSDDTAKEKAVTAKRKIGKKKAKLGGIRGCAKVLPQ
jgi:hypothetical protein